MHEIETLTTYKKEKRKRDEKSHTCNILFYASILNNKPGATTHGMHMYVHIYMSTVLQLAAITVPLESWNMQENCGMGSEEEERQ